MAYGSKYYKHSKKYAYGMYKKLPPYDVMVRRGIQTARLINDIHQIKQRLNTEKKYVDVVNISDYTGTFDVANGTDHAAQRCFTDCVQGTDNNERIGRQIKVLNCKVRCGVRYNAAGPASQLARMIVIQDYAAETSTNIQSLNDVLQDSSNVRSFLKLDETRQNRVLYDKYIKLDAEHDYKELNLNRKMASKISYTGTGATSRGKGAILLFMITDAATNGPTYSMQSRVRFVDN